MPIPGADLSYEQQWPVSFNVTMPQLSLTRELYKGMSVYEMTDLASMRLSTFSSIDQSRWDQRLEE